METRPWGACPGTVPAPQAGPWWDMYGMEMSPRTVCTARAVGHPRNTPQPQDTLLCGHRAKEGSSESRRSLPAALPLGDGMGMVTHRDGNPGAHRTHPPNTRYQHPLPCTPLTSQCPVPDCQHPSPWVPSATASTRLSPMPKGGQGPKMTPHLPGAMPPLPRQPQRPPALAVASRALRAGSCLARACRDLPTRHPAPHSQHSPPGQHPGVLHSPNRPAGPGELSGTARACRAGSGHGVRGRKEGNVGRTAQPSGGHRHRTPAPAPTTPTPRRGPRSGAHPAAAAKRESWPGRGGRAGRGRKRPRAPGMELGGGAGSVRSGLPHSPSRHGGLPHSLAADPAPAWGLEPQPCPGDPTWGH